MLAHDPEFTYKRLLQAADIAKKLGAQIMGLGAFTKVVGDAGVTVAKRAPLPITTGNSYSASGALWALHDALRRLGIADVDEEGRLLGKAMVVGATGAIGSVCARLLAMACDELWMVSPEAAKLLALKADIESENPRAKIFVAATPDDALPDMDAIVTATSGAGKRVLDIMQVKPGAVITDVARPLDLSAEDVAKRPDVLVVESGEILLPGDVHMKNIGLPPGVAYACLAETIASRALEGRYETFTIGRNIEWPKVKEIYRLGLETRDEARDDLRGERRLQRRGSRAGAGVGTCQTRGDGRRLRPVCCERPSIAAGSEEQADQTQQGLRQEHDEQRPGDDHRDLGSAVTLAQTVTAEQYRDHHRCHQDQSSGPTRDQDRKSSGIVGVVREQREQPFPHDHRQRETDQ